MRLIDIDRIKMVDDHIHYRKEYEGSAIVMDNAHKIVRSNIKFSIEYKPIGAPLIQVKFIDTNDKLLEKLVPKIIHKIAKLDHDGVFADLHRK